MMLFVFSLTLHRRNGPGKQDLLTPLKQFIDFALQIWSGKLRNVNTSRAIHWLRIADVVLETTICERVS